MPTKLISKNLVIIAGYQSIENRIEPYCIIGASLCTLSEQLSKIDMDSASIRYTFAGDISKYRIANYTRLNSDLKLDIDNAVVGFKTQLKAFYD